MTLSSAQSVRAAEAPPPDPARPEAPSGAQTHDQPDAHPDDRPAEPPCALVVTGMHRSGTSALARALSLMGAGLPDVLVPAGPGNVAGHWEPEALRDWSDHTLGALGGGWDDWRRIDADAQSTAWREAAVANLADVIARAVGGRDRVVLKDPRLCRLAPFLFDALAQLSMRPFVIIALRNPVAVMDSLSVRDGMVRGYAALLWLRHMLEIEERTRDLPRCVVDYDTLLADWRGVAMRLRASGAPLVEAEADAAALDAFLTPGLRHHDVEPASLQRDPDATPWLRAAHAALATLADAPGDRGALAALDATRALFEQACSAFAPSQTEHHLRENRLFQNIQTARAEAAACAAAAASAIETLKGVAAAGPTPGGRA